MNHLNQVLKSVNSYWDSLPSFSSFRPDGNTPVKILESMKVYASQLKNNKWTYVVLGSTVLLTCIYRIYKLCIENQNLQTEKQNLQTENQNLQTENQNLQTEKTSLEARNSGLQHQLNTPLEREYFSSLKSLAKVLEPYGAPAIRSKNKGTDIVRRIKEETKIENLSELLNKVSIEYHSGPASNNLFKFLTPSSSLHKLMAYVKDNSKNGTFEILDKIPPKLVELLNSFASEFREFSKQLSSNN